MSSEVEEFEVVGDFSDEAIEALAALLLSVAEQEMVEAQTATIPVEAREAT